ncbi:hypothetical protein Pyn_04986 [Prunus yedoensis var. nudiflora]|uniref:Uncharacterized protein n=1 Tax=Prunus yedoensis var. nudiflora TaxID=2094558 RepID=A0A314UH38_PRUYE|nr:hypothetical protein Pyn_04986 [Prunus yedoensis var. nudiflora]
MALLASFVASPSAKSISRFRASAKANRMIRDSRSSQAPRGCICGQSREKIDTRGVEALQAVKDMFPRISNSELMAPVDNVAVSTRN